MYLKLQTREEIDRLWDQLPLSKAISSHIVFRWIYNSAYKHADGKGHFKMKINVK